MPHVVRPPLPPSLIRSRRNADSSLFSPLSPLPLHHSRTPRSQVRPNMTWVEVWMGLMEWFPSRNRPAREGGLLRGLLHRGRGHGAARRHADPRLHARAAQGTRRAHCMKERSPHGLLPRVRGSHRVCSNITWMMYMIAKRPRDHVFSRIGRNETPGLLQGKQPQDLQRKGKGSQAVVDPTEDRKTLGRSVL